MPPKTNGDGIPKAAMISPAMPKKPSPIPVLMINGRYDFFFPLETSQRPLYELLGTPEEHKRWVVYDGGHAVPRTKFIEESLAWLDEYLGVVE